MFKKNLKFRKENKLDSCIGINYPEKAIANQFYPRGYVGVDKIGRPLYVERVGKLKVKELTESCDEDRLWLAFYQSFEELHKHKNLACSHKY